MEAAKGEVVVVVVAGAGHARWRPILASHPTATLLLLLLLTLPEGVVETAEEGGGGADVRPRAEVTITWGTRGEKAFWPDFPEPIPLPAESDACAWAAEAEAEAEAGAGVEAGGG